MMVDNTKVIQQNEKYRTLNIDINLINQLR